jgi:hypothetical protein
MFLVFLCAVLYLPKNYDVFFYDAVLYLPKKDR